MEASPPQPPMPEGNGQAQQQIPIRKRTIITNVTFNVLPLAAEMNGGEPGRVLQFVDMSGEAHEIPMSMEAAAKMAAQLEGRHIEVASAMPPVPPPTPPA